jgi:hypothetical protein
MKGQFSGALLTLPHVAEDLLHDHADLRIKRTEVVRPAAGVAVASIAKILNPTRAKNRC